MLRIKTNNDKFIEFKQENNLIIINNETQDIDISRLEGNHFHIIRNNKSYRAEILARDPGNKSYRIKINDEVFDIMVQDKYDLLKEKFGVGDKGKSSAEDVKAPMPGLLLEIKVQKGSQVNKGDVLFVLEAMKMENIIKSPANGTITEVLVKAGQSVEKNQVLARF